MPKQETTVEHNEIFRWCEEKFGLWHNQCCDLFHRTEVIDYPSDTWYVWDGFHEEEIETAKEYVRSFDFQKLDYSKLGHSTTEQLDIPVIGKYAGNVAQVLVNMFMDDHNIKGDCRIVD